MGARRLDAHEAQAVRAMAAARLAAGEVPDAVAGAIKTYLRARGWRPTPAARRAREAVRAEGITLPQLRAMAAPATVEDDRQARCYRATAPAGMRWEPGLHELLACYEERCWAAEARKALADDLRGRSPEPCDDPDCDWCADPE